MDESGDLGFNFRNKGTSRFFVITLIFCSSKRPLEKVVKKTFRSLPQKVQRKHSGCLHAVKEKPKTRFLLLGLLNKQDISIITIYLNKKKVYTKLHDEKHVLYNYVTNILLDRVYTKKLIPTRETIQLIASRRETNKFLNDNFKHYLENQIVNNHKLRIAIEVKPPHAEKGLQAADFVCWAIYRKIEKGGDSYANIISSKIVEESPLFP